MINTVSVLQLILRSCQHEEKIRSSWGWKEAGFLPFSTENCLFFWIDWVWSPVRHFIKCQSCIRNVVYLTQLCHLVSLLSFLIYTIILFPCSWQGFVSCSSSVGSMCCTYSRMFPFVRESNLPSFCCHEHLSPHRLLNPSKIRWSAQRRWIRTSSVESRPSLPLLSEFSAMWELSQQQLSTLNQCDMIERFYKSFTFICACVCVLTRVCVCECHVYTGAYRDQKKALGSHELVTGVCKEHDRGSRNKTHFSPRKRDF